MPRTFRNEAEWRDFLVEVMESHGRLFYKLAHGVLRDSMAAEDACQEAFTKALERSKMLREAGSLQAWLAKVVVNEALLVRRRRATESRVLRRRASGTSEAAPMTGDWLMRDEVVDAIDQLPEEPRVVVVLRVLNGMSGAEVKELLNCSESHVSRQLHSGMKMLRQLLQDWKTTVEKQ